jgi:hypothetical protein
LASVNDVFSLVAMTLIFKKQKHAFEQWNYTIGPEREDKIRHTDKTIYQWSIMSAINQKMGETDIIDDFEEKFQGVVEGIKDIFNNEVTSK